MAGRMRVVTLPGDVHAGAVEWALADRGIATEWMSLTDFPAARQHSFVAGDSAREAGIYDSLPDTFCDYVWIRRVGRSPAVPEGLDPRDHALCQRESERFFWGLLQAMAPDAWWVNPLDSYLTSRNNKLKQLQVARACGFTVPETLASNNPSHIRAFFAVHAGRIISKPFFPHLWNGRDGSSHEYMSSMISAQDLENDGMLQASPLIYQRFVEKAYELRVAVFGRACIAAKLHSADDPDLLVDWRHPSKHPVIEPYNLPDVLRDCCFRMMDALGLVHGSFDFIVKPDGQFVFLEVNESGQCLWLEEDCPELPVLSALVGLFLERSPDYTERDFRKYPYRFADFLGGAGHSKFRRQAAEDHLPGTLHGVMFQE
ncbi:hypothetical protein [Xanthomonas arboricola]|uniref:hypothetical protein n=1 Tax=Xanthomonas arboricola TaxID=56448 RepID=UPI000C86CCBA|nr:hypothetical protein [Xanthomonas arboricola]